MALYERSHDEKFRDALLALPEVREWPTDTINITVPDHDLVLTLKDYDPDVAAQEVATTTFSWRKGEGAYCNRWVYCGERGASR